MDWQMFSGHFICILFPRHDHVFTECYMDNFTENITEMLMHAHAIGTRPLLRGLGTRLINHGIKGFQNNVIVISWESRNYGSKPIPRAQPKGGLFM